MLDLRLESWQEYLMVAHKFDLTVGQDRTLLVKDVPFDPGEQVEVIVMEHAKGGATDRWRALQGSVIRYERPADPVGEDDWEALK
jgi:hypothetical protein